MNAAETIMNTKLTINLRDGILDVDGSEEFVRTVYEDFKGEVAKRLPLAADAQRQIEAAPLTLIEPIAGTTEVKPKKQPHAKRATATGEGQKARTGKYKPTFDPNLDLNGLVEFYDELKPMNAAEKILIFAVFLKERLKIVPCTADQIFTCFFTVKDRTKIPEAFEQAFRDTQSRTHFIQVTSLQDITVTIPGSNHFVEMKKRKAVK